MQEFECAFTHAHRWTDKPPKWSHLLHQIVQFFCIFFRCEIGYSVITVMMPDISYCWIDAADYGVYKLETKTKSDSGIDFTVNCSSNHDTKKFIGSLETKYKWSDYGEQKYRLVSLACSVTCTDHCRHWRRQAPCRKIAISTVSRQFWWTCAYRRALLRSWSKSVLDHPGSPSAAW